ncbi:recombinase zinc beta ribbon domain-containing protein [Clostridioides difficile]|nr:recombinase zinc beta ribbon domain-containing protein [Clostridioides difficile]
MFSGLLYCADCGSKMTFHRQMAQSAEKHNFVCKNYRHNSKSCTMHYIRNVVVEQIVLENLKEVIRYVSDYEDEFVQMVMDTDMRQRNKELSQKKNGLQKSIPVFKSWTKFFNGFMKTILVENFQMSAL